MHIYDIPTIVILYTHFYRPEVPARFRRSLDVGTSTSRPDSSVDALESALAENHELKQVFDLAQALMQMFDLGLIRSRRSHSHDDIRSAIANLQEHIAALERRYMSQEAIQNVE